MKKILKVIPTVLLAALTVWLVYYFASGSYKHITLQELSIVLTEKAGIETGDPVGVLTNMGAVDPGIPTEQTKSLTREEAYSVVSRFFFLNENDGSNINYIRDSSKIKTEYKLDIAGLLCEMYIDKGRFHPQSKAKYRDVIKSVDKILGSRAESGEISSELYEGNITLDGVNATSTGNTYPYTFVMCGEGATLNLSGTEIKGHIAVVSGDNKIVLDGTSKVNRGIFIMNGATCTISSGDGAVYKVYSSGKLTLNGNTENISVFTGGDVSINGNVGYVAMEGAGKVVYESGTFGAVYSKTDGASIRINAGVSGTQISSSNEASKTEITVAGTVEKVETESPDCLVDIKPTADIVVLNIFDGADGTQVVIEKGAKTKEVNNEEEKAAIVDQRSKWDGR